MQTVHVSASREYDVLIGKGVSALLTQQLKTLFGSVRVCVVSDDRVALFHLDRTQALLRDGGYACDRFVFPHGEASKNPDTLFSLLEFLAEKHYSRKDVLLALGGGVTGDLCGLAAALFMRGMRLVQMPTTLLSMVDSSVGGKTAVNLKNGKNLAGVFNQPSLVLCDLDLLETLPDEEFACGMAEVIKYGVIADKDLFAQVKGGISKQDPQMEQIVTRCVSIKRDVVCEDEFDTGKRALLNFGHTLGHAVEKESGFTIPHGKAVAVGMVRMAQIAEENGLSDAPCSAQIMQALESNLLPTDAPFSNAQLYPAATGDKKQAGGFITLIVPRKIGVCYEKKVSLETLKELLR